MGSMRRAVMGTGLLLATVLASAGEPAAATPVNLDIKSQPMADALNQWAQATGFQVIFPEESATAQLVAPEVRGRYVPAVALTKLLENSGLRYEYVNEHTVSVKVAQAGPVKPASDQDKENARPLALARAQSESPRMAGQSRTSEAPASQAARSGNSEKLEEIVVTAQKRSERLLDVPVPVSVIDAQSLTDSNQTLLRDYYNSVPALNLTTYAAGVQSFVVRGISPVGITLDGVPFGGSSGLTGGGDLPDIDPGALERVEVLRGPQGTLYGVDSMGGLVNFVTKEPSTAGYAARLEAGTAGVSNGDSLGYTFRASGNMPLSDTLAVRASGFTRQDPGYIDNPNLHLTGVNRGKADGGSLSALWQPSDSWSVRFNALYQHHRMDGLNDVNVPTPLYPQTAGLRDLQQNYIPGIQGVEHTDQGYSAIVKARLGAVDLISLTAYNQDVTSSGADFTFAYAPLIENAYPGTGASGANFRSDDDTVGRFSEELRLSATIGEKFDWLLGGIYSHEHYSEHDSIWAEVIDTGQLVGQYYHYVYTATFDEAAAFADLTFHFNDRFDVQVGGRQSHGTLKVGEGVTTGPAVADFYPGSPSPYVTPPTESTSNVFTYLLTPRFKVSPDLMVYARLASGYRPGIPNPAAPGIPSQSNPDKTKNYELGVKGNFLDHQLSVDASAYYIDWKNIQLGFIDLQSFFGYSGNGGAAKSEGVELSVSSKPLQGLTVEGWIVYNDAALTENLPQSFVPFSPAYGLSGARLPYASRWSANLSVQQEFPLWSGANGFVGVAASYVGDSYGSFQGTDQNADPLPRQTYPSYTKTDVHAGIKQRDWTVNFYVNNVADVRGQVGGGIGVNPPYAFFYITPRTIGLSVSKTFD